MRKLFAPLLILVIPFSPAFAADAVDPIAKLPEIQPLTASAIPGAALAPAARADVLIQGLAAADLTPTLAAQHLEALTAMAAASPAALSAAQTAQIADLRAQLPARFASDAEASRVLGAKMDRLAAALQGEKREPSDLSDLKGAAVANAAPALAPASPHQGRGLGIDTSAMDLSVRPQDDFYRHVNGTWLKTFQIPADKARFGSFDAVSEGAEEAVKAIIEKAGDGKIAELFKSFMNTDAIEARGLKPLEKDLAAIRRIHSKEALAGAFGGALKLGFSAPVDLGVAIDAKNPSAYITQLGQSGLGLPNRDYYFEEGADADNIRARYLDYATKLLTLAGETEPRAKAEKVYSLEKALAAHQWTNVEQRDVKKSYNKMSVEELGRLAPGFGWPEYLRAVGIPENQTELIVAEPSYLAGFADVFNQTSLDDWKVYLKLRALSASAGLLPKAFVDASFEYSRVFTGQTEIRPRWKRGVGLVNGALGELVGQEYIKDHFPQSSKTRMENLVENLRAAYAERISGLTWMGEQTKQRALEKLAKFTHKIGFPRKWIDYSALEIRPDDLAGNVRRSNQFDHDRMLAKLGKPVDLEEWHMYPQTVNAYYDPVTNQIVFPAAILQFPFFNPEADDAVNYGAIGAVIGHEMGHGYDDQGAKFDGNGMMRDWWTKEDEAAFEARTAKLVAQYDAFETLPGVHVNGKLTLGENIGDLGGLTVAYRAYRMSLKGKEAPVIGGFTGDQRFFMGYAQVWRLLMRDAAKRQQVVVDPHSPAEFRVNGVLRNMPEFYQAFGVGPGDRLYLPDNERVGIW